MSPFAHPLFTVLTGIGFGIAALSARAPAGPPGAAAAVRAAARDGHARPVERLVDLRRRTGFFAVYAAFMVPAFGLLTWLVDLDPAARAAHRPRRAARVRGGRLADRRPSRSRSARCGPGDVAREYARAATADARRRGRSRSTRRTRRRWPSCATGGAAGARGRRTSSCGSRSCCTSCGSAGRWPARPWPRGTRRAPAPAPSAGHLAVVRHRATADGADTPYRRGYNPVPRRS